MLKVPLRLLFLCVVTVVPVTAAGPDSATTGALLKSQGGELLSDREVTRIVQWQRIAGLDPNPTFELGQRKAIFRLEIGQPPEGDDMSRLIQVLGRPGLRLEVFEARRRIIYPPFAKAKDFRPFRTIWESEFPPDLPTGWEPFIVAKVLQANHSCVFQHRTGNKFIFQYSNGIVFTNYREGAVFFVNTRGDKPKENCTLLRSRRDQKAQILRVICLEP